VSITSIDVIILQHSNPADDAKLQHESALWNSQRTQEGGMYVNALLCKQCGTIFVMNLLAK